MDFNIELCKKCNLILRKESSLVTMYFDIKTKIIKNYYKCPGCKNIIIFADSDKR